MRIARLVALLSALTILVSGCGGAPAAQPTSPPAATQSAALTTASAAAPSAQATAPTAAAEAAPTQAAASGEAITLTLVAYSTPREAYEEIIPLFLASPGGAGITFEQSYGTSGDQSRAVENGLGADIVALSLAPDVNRLIKSGLVTEDWAKDEYQGMVTDSVVVFAVRPGNPKNIKTWDDLIEPGIEVLTPNPVTSGGARWNVMAAYGAQTKTGKSHDQAVEYLRALFTNVVVQDKSARESLQTFTGGKGDVLLAYENEVIFAKQNGQELDYVVPDQTILIENPVALVASSKHPEQARAFIAFLRTQESQKIYGEKGYRPVVKEVLAEFDYPTPPVLFTIADFGGWSEVQAKFFNAEDGIMTLINQGLGVQ